MPIPLLGSWSDTQREKGRSRAGRSYFTGSKDQKDLETAPREKERLGEAGNVLARTLPSWVTVLSSCTV